MAPILDICNVSKQYGDGDNAVLALKDVNFSITQGEFTGVMGSSGSGKSTLLNVIATIDKATGGYVFLGNQDIAKFTENGIAEFRRDNLGFIFQDYNLLDTLTLRENIALALTIQKSPKYLIGGIIDEIAEKLGIGGVLDKFPYEVSGGQRQRCACARAVASKPRLILADEPTGALDSVSAQNLMETFSQINAEMGATILMVTHDAFSACYCRRILFMRDGNIVAELRKGDLNNTAFLRELLNILESVNRGGRYVS